MKIRFKEYTVEVVNDLTYTLGSNDNSFTYDNVYSNTEYQPTSKHGVLITKDGQQIASAIVCEAGGVTGVDENSFTVVGDNLLICCGSKVYSLKLPQLTLNWDKEFDSATCFAVYPFKEDFIIHRELNIKRVDRNGNVKWDFSAKEILVTQNGAEAVRLIEDEIVVTDWTGDSYLLNEDGQATKYTIDN